jgi:transcriptional regulator with XRE-family HTH domain
MIAIAIMNISNKIRENVKAIRLNKKLSQGDVAKILGAHPTYISQIERGIRNPTMRNIEKIANALGVPINELLK